MAAATAAKHLHRAIRRRIMFDKIRRNAFFLAAFFFLWQGWSSVHAAPETDEDAEEEKKAGRIPSIRANFLRGAGEADAEAPTDPFGVLQQALEKQAAAMEELGVTDSGVIPDVSGTETAAASTASILRLESTMRANRSWVARINGQTLQVGDALRGFDENQPPVLVSVDGTVAKLRYDSQIITLDLTGEASVSVD